MGVWKNVSKAGARRAGEAGLPVRLISNGHQVWVENAAEEEAATVEEAISPTVYEILETPVKDLADVLSTVASPMEIVRAAARDPRTSARPIYRRALGETSEEEEREAAEEELAALGLAPAAEQEDDY